MGERGGRAVEVSVELTARTLERAGTTGGLEDALGDLGGGLVGTGRQQARTQVPAQVFVGGEDVGDGQGHGAGGEVLADGLAEFVGGTAQVEEVIGELKGDTRPGCEASEGVEIGLRGAGQQGAADGCEGEQRGRLAQGNALEGGDVEVDPPSAFELFDLAEHEVLEGGRGEQVERAEADTADERQGAHEKEVTGDDADSIAPYAPGSGPAPAHDGVVDDVVVQERGGMEHLHGGSDGQGVCRRGRVVDGPSRGDEDDGRAEAFAASGDEVSRSAGASGIRRQAGREQFVDTVEVGTEQVGECCEAGTNILGAVMARGEGGDLGDARFLKEGFGLHSLVS